MTYSILRDAEFETQGYDYVRVRNVWQPLLLWMTVTVSPYFSDGRGGGGSEQFVIRVLLEYCIAEIRWRQTAGRLVFRSTRSIGTTVTSTTHPQVQFTTTTFCSRIRRSTVVPPRSTVPRRFQLLRRRPPSTTTTMFRLPTIWKRSLASSNSEGSNSALPRPMSDLLLELSTETCSRRRRSAGSRRCSWASKTCASWNLCWRGGWTRPTPLRVTSHLPSVDCPASSDLVCQSIYQITHLPRTPTLPSPTSQPWWTLQPQTSLQPQPTAPNQDNHTEWSQLSYESTV